MVVALHERDELLLAEQDSPVLANPSMPNTRINETAFQCPCSELPDQNQCQRCYPDYQARRATPG
jgi:hypothetical protein